jgi:hypothetical protein
MGRRGGWGEYPDARYHDDGDYETMIRYILFVMFLGWSLLLTASPSHAEIFGIVQAGVPFFANNDPPLFTPNPSGTRVCIRLVIFPYGSTNVATVTECGARTALVASTSCAAIKTLIIARAAQPPFSATVTAEEVLVSGCPQ